MELNIIISIIGAALSVATFAAGRLSVSRNNGKEFGQMLSEIAYIKCGMDEIKSDIRSVRKESTEIRIEHARHKEDIDDLRRRVTELEKKVTRYHEEGART